MSPHSHGTSGSLVVKTMRCLRLVGSMKFYVSFPEYSLFYRALLQKRPIILRSLLIVFTAYWIYCIQRLRADFWLVWNCISQTSPNSAHFWIDRDQKYYVLLGQTSNQLGLVDLYVHRYVHTYIYIFIYIYTYIYVLTYKYTCIASSKIALRSLFSQVYVCVCIYIYI